MIDEYWTWIFYGYHSDELTYGSGKLIVGRCDKCCKYRISKMQSYCDLCHSCAVTKAPLNLDGMHVCRLCGIPLIVGDNIGSTQLNAYNYMCNSCATDIVTSRNHVNGISKPYTDNKKCSSYLGVGIAERVLSHVFKNVELMPMSNPGYDFICNHGKKIDVKSSCRYFHIGRSDSWMFTINKNTSADYFLCIAFDDREHLNPEHVWLIPGDV